MVVMYVCVLYTRKKKERVEEYDDNDGDGELFTRP